MAKIDLDKYYTPETLAKYCVEKTNDVIGAENITCYIEPSAGGGVFLPYLDKPYIALDIKPEHDKVKEQDFLKTNFKYRKGLCVIGNPPFGVNGSLVYKFYKKSIQFSDYISFILPISKLNNTKGMFEFDLIHSEDLGVDKYSGVKVHCCLNIYKRSPKIKFEMNYELHDIIILVHARGVTHIKEIKDGIRICAFGSAGKLVTIPDTHCHEMVIICTDPMLEEQVYNVIRCANWKKIYKMFTPYSLSVWQVLKYLKEQIPELEYKHEKTILKMLEV